MSLNTTAINIHTPASNYRIRPNWNGKPYGVIQEDHMPCWAETSITDTPRTHTIAEPPKDSDADEYAFAVDSVRVPVNTVDEWLPVTSGKWQIGDKFTIDDEPPENCDNWSTIDQDNVDSGLSLEEWIQRGNLIRRRNPNYKPMPFTPRPATWEDVKVGAKFAAGKPSNYNPDYSNTFEVVSVYPDRVITERSSDRKSETASRQKFEGTPITLISPAPEAKP